MAKFVGLVRWTDTQCRIDKKLGFNFFNKNCICNEADFVNAVKDDFNDIIVLCEGTEITVSNEIDITDKVVRIRGDEFYFAQNPYRKAKLIGAGSNRLFTGSPRLLVMDDVIMEGFSGDGNGGAIRLTGGSAVIDQCVFLSNTATGNGGGISVESATVTVHEHAVF